MKPFISAVIIVFAVANLPLSLWLLFVIEYLSSYPGSELVPGSNLTPIARLVTVVVGLSISTYFSIATALKWQAPRSVHAWLLIPINVAYLLILYFLAQLHYYGLMLVPGFILLLTPGLLVDDSPQITRGTARLLRRGWRLEHIFLLIAVFMNVVAVPVDAGRPYRDMTELSDPVREVWVGTVLAALYVVWHIVTFLAIAGLVTGLRWPAWVGLLLTAIYISAFLILRGGLAVPMIVVPAVVLVYYAYQLRRMGASVR